MVSDEIVFFWWILKTTLISPMDFKDFFGLKLLGLVELLFELIQDNFIDSFYLTICVVVFIKEI